MLHTEIGSDFILNDALQWGTLPWICTATDDASKHLFLRAYTETYLQEEILIEQIVRNLPPFRRFLQIAAQSNTAIVNYAKIATYVLTHPTNIRNYFEILEDTLLGFMLAPFHHSIRKRQRQSPKFYWIDTGIVRALAGLLDLSVNSGTYEYGRLFGSFIINQIRTSLEYSLCQYQLSYLSTKENAEVDLIVERADQPTLLIEIKSGSIIKDESLNTLNRFQGDIKGSRAVCLYQGTTQRVVGKVEVLPWQYGLRELDLV